MERIIWTHQSEQPFYVLDGKHIVHFWEDGLSIHTAGECYQDAETRLSPFDGPHIYPKALPLEFYKGAVLYPRLPISLDIEGDNLGAIKSTPGYGDAELGSYKRTIVGQRTKLSVADDYLVVDITLHATPADPKTVDADASEEDKAPQDYEFQLRFPLDLVPEVLNLTETERRRFERARSG